MRLEVGERVYVKNDAGKIINLHMDVTPPIAIVRFDNGSVAKVATHRIRPITDHSVRITPDQFKTVVCTLINDISRETGIEDKDPIITAYIAFGVQLSKRIFNS